MVIKYRDRIVLVFDFNQCISEELHYRVFDLFSFVFSKKDDFYIVSIVSKKYFNSSFVITLSNTDLSVLEQEVDSFMNFLSYI